MKFKDIGNSKDKLSAGANEMGNPPPVNPNSRTRAQRSMRMENPSLTGGDNPDRLHTTSDRAYLGFQDRMRQGKIKLCDQCGGIMMKSSRRLLSGMSGFSLLVLGAVLMAVYGLALHYTLAPSFIKFLLPAAYYMGAIFIAIGVVFIIIRERVWLCDNCKRLDKR